MIKSIRKLSINKVVYKGFGLGYYKNYTVFVNNALPGDNVDVEIYHRKQNILYGNITNLNKHSYLYKKPVCNSFELCGGCNWLNTDYENQLSFKNQIIKEIFKDFADKITTSITASTRTKYYRNKSFLPVKTVDNKTIIGMYAKGSHNIVEIDDCVILPEEINQMKKALLVYIKKSKISIYKEENHSGNLRHFGFYLNQTGEMLLVIVTRNRKLPFSKVLAANLNKEYPQLRGIIQNINKNPGNKILGKEEKLIFGRKFLHYTISPGKFRVNYRSFFQINSYITRKMYRFIKENITENSSVIDAYSGVGSIGIFVADKTEEMYLIENNEIAVKDAQTNVEINKSDNVKIIYGDTAHKLPELLDKTEIDTIIFDPPRKGIQSNIIDKIGETNIDKIIYVSCNPMTQKRDVEIFLKYSYKVTEMQAFDMFPHTYHIENVIILEK